MSASDKLYRLLEEGSERVEKELDVVNMVQNIRNQKILMRELNFLDKMVKLKISNLGWNVIDIDDDAYEAKKVREQRK